MASNNLEYTLRLKDLFSKTMQGAANQVKGLDSKMSALKSSLGGLGSLVAGAFAVGSVVSFGKAVFASLDNFQKFHASIKTMLHGNENAAKALEMQLMNLAKTTPFEITEVQNASKQLLAYGFKAGNVVDTMRTLGDVSAGIGAPLGDIAYLYGTLKTSGRVTLMDLRQFAGRGIPIYEVLAKRLNTTTNAINKMVHDGKLGFKDIEGAFKDMTKEGGQFFNLMADQSKTVGGRWSNISDTWEQIKVNIGNSQTGIINGTLDFIGKMADALNTKLSAQNFLDDAMKKTKQKFTFLDHMYANLGVTSLSGGLRGFEAKAAEYQSVVTGGMGSQKDIKQNLEYFQEANRLSKEKYARDKDLASYEIRSGLIGQSISSLRGGLDMLKSKENPTLGANGKTLGGGEKSTSKTLGSGTEVTGQRPQSLTINITKLVESLNVQTTNLTEGAGKIKEMVSKHLLEAVNDINLTAMA
jgi:tape measure domain-containing protein